MSGQRVPYPTLAGELVESINVLLSVGELQVPGDRGAVVSIGPAQAPESYDDCLALGVTVGGSTIRIRLNASAVGEALGQLLPASALAALDDDLKLALLETALTEPLGALRTLLGAEVVLESLDAGRAEDGADSVPHAVAGDGALNSLVFEVRAPADVVRCRVLVDLLSPLPPSVLARLASPAGSRVKDFGGLPVPVTFELGTASLSAAECGSLAAGDVVLFDRCYVLDGRVRINIADRNVQVGTLDGLTLTVENSS